MVTVLLIVGTVFVIFINTWAGGVMLILAIWMSIIRFLMIGKTGGAKRKKDDS